MATTVTTKGQVTIPKPLRDLLVLRPGSRVEFRRTADGRVELIADDARPRGSAFAALRGHAGQGMTTSEIMALTRGDA